MKSKSRSTDNSEDIPATLRAATDAREQRTITLVKQSVDALVAAGQPVSIAMIEKTSKKLDPDGRGVSKSAIDRNPVANHYYKQHRNYKPPGRKRLATPDRLIAANAHRIKPDRDPERARQRYSRLTKEELIIRLIAIENSLAQEQEQGYQEDDQLLKRFLEVEEQENFESFESGTTDENLQPLLSKIERLKAENQELKARLIGTKSLEAENDELKKQNSHLMNQLKIQTADTRKQDATRFRQALEGTKPVELPEVEF